MTGEQPNNQDSIEELSLDGLVSEQAPDLAREAGRPVTRNKPLRGHIPVVQLSPERSAELQAELADIRWAQIAAAGPGVIGGRPQK